MDNNEMISGMLDDIAAQDAVAAQDKFNAVMSQKISDALDARKVEVASSIYSKDSNEDDSSTND